MEWSFLQSDLTDPPQIFDAHLLKNTNLSPSSFHFSMGFISRSCFESDGFIAYSNEWDWREKKTIFIHTMYFLELAMSQRWSAIFCATGVFGRNILVRRRSLKLERNLVSHVKNLRQKKGLLRANLRVWPYDNFSFEVSLVRGEELNSLHNRFCSSKWKSSPPSSLPSPVTT